MTEDFTDPKEWERRITNVKPEQTLHLSSGEMPKVELEDPNQLVEIKIMDRGRVVLHGIFALKTMNLKPIIHTGRKEKKETEIIFTNHY